MAKYCEICHKGVLSGNKVSHSHRKTRRTWAPNIQKTHILLNGTATRVNICTRCLRTGKVVRAL